MSKNPKYKDDDIAIIGMAGRFPEADDLEAFWLNLTQGRESIREFPKSRKAELTEMVGQIAEIDFAHGGYLERTNLFEPEIFSLSQEECKYIDPQHRILLELVEEALLNAGYNPIELANAYVGVFISDNRYNYIERLAQGSPMTLVNSITASSAGRIAYLYNFHGPALTIGTACSSTLVALHTACQYLRLGEIDFAIVGGTDLILLPPSKAEAKNMAVLSPDQRVRAFDKDANGTVGGEGGGVIFLKAAKKALADGDYIHAVIKGSAVNSDGHWSNGISAPSEKGQADVILRAVEKAEIDPLSISYIETHGTGTKVGDPIEIAGITRALNQLGFLKKHVPIGSLKTNIGHLSGSAGVASVIKTVLALQYKQIPPSLNFVEPNPLIDFANTPVYVNNQLREWQSDSIRRAGITSLGLIGTNCHIILEEGPQLAEPIDKAATKELLILSARTENSLHAIIAKLLDHLNKRSNLPFRDLVYTLMNGRRSFRHKFALLASSTEEVRTKLHAYLNDIPSARQSCSIFAQEQNEELAPLFILPDLAYADFTLYGELYANIPHYREAVEEYQKNVTQADLEDRKIQYLLHVCSYAKLLESYSIKPKAILGFGLGELVANYIREKASFAKTLTAVKNYNAPTRNISIEQFSTVIDKIITTGINTFILISPTPVLGNTFSKLLAKKRDMYYANGWVECKLGGKTAKQGNVLIISDGSGLASELGHQMKKAGRFVYEGTGKKFEDFTILLNKFKDKGITQIIHLLTVNGGQEIKTIADLEQSQQQGVFSLFHLTKAILTARLSEVEIILVAENVSVVTKQEKSLHPEHASLFGLGKVLKQEYPQIRCRALDIPSLVDQSIIEEVGRFLTEELAYLGETYQVAYRQGQRYVEEFRKISLENTLLQEITIKENGVYLITGGTGGMGLEFAKYLASLGKVKLALINRSPVPKRVEWDEILKKGADPRLSHKLMLLKEIEALGAELNYCTADIANLEIMQSLIQDLRNKYGKINGIIHCAGNAGDGIIFNRTEEAFSNVLAPKVFGTWILDYVTKEDEPDFFINCSSAVILGGGAGQGDYTAANSYQDAFAVFRSSKGRRTLTINWPTWKETGMAVDYGVNFDKGLFKALRTKEAIEGFAALLEKNISHVYYGEINPDFVESLKGQFPVEVSKEVKDLWTKSKPTKATNLAIFKADTFYTALTDLIKTGLEVDWSKVYHGQKMQRLNLPGYVFDRKSYVLNFSHDTYYNWIDKLQVKAQKTVSTPPEAVKETVAPLTPVQNTLYVKERIIELFTELRSGEAFSLESGFFDLGISSLAVMYFIGKIKQEFNVELSVTLFFEDISVGAMIDKIYNVILQNTLGSNFIARQPEQEYYPVSSAQKRLYALLQIEENNICYNMPSIFILEGPLERARFTTAFQKLVKRHESLRTSIDIQNGQLLQHIHRDLEFAVHYREVKEDEIPELVQKFVRPFDLSKAPLLRVELVKFGENQHLLMFDMHHIISDGTSKGILINNFIQLYQGMEMPDLKIQYRDFAVWQNDLFTSEKIKVQEEYWLARFAEEVPVLNLPTDYPRPYLVSFEGDTVNFYLTQELKNSLNELAARQGATLYMAILAVYNILLAKYSGQEDVVIGSPIAGRTHADLEELIGLFVNTLAMRNAPVGEKTFINFLIEVKEHALQAYANQDYQFEMLVEKLNLQRDLSRNPLFDTIVVMHNINTTKSMIIGDLKFTPYMFQHNAAPLDLTIDIFEATEGIQFAFQYRTKLFKKTTIERFTSHFVNIIKAIVTNPEIAIKDIEVLSPEERQQLLVEFNATDAAFPAEKTMHQWFEEVAESRGNSIAVDFEGKRLSYFELNEQANRLARVLRAKGLVSPDTIVGLMVERSLDTAIGILGILKAGGAYLPIDPDFPEERIMYLFEDSRSEILVTQKSLLTKVDFLGTVIEISETITSESSNLASLSSPQNLAYIIYTSGSTGKPKGVMIEHQSIINYTHWRIKAYNYTTEDVTLQLLSYSFDGFCSNFYSSLLSGGKLYLLEKNHAKDLYTLKHVIREAQITNMALSPTMYQAILESSTPEDLQSLRLVVMGGEKIASEVVKLSINTGNNILLINEYGPTENCVASTALLGVPLGEERVIIGTPIDNTKIYIVDKWNKPVPCGVPGELCITGKGQARGYLYRPELTAEKFVINPFLRDSRMYRTGDLARWTNDGKLEFLGRIDSQVKIRGYRIEIGEIENCLLQHPAISEVLVLDRNDEQANKYLCAYFITLHDVTITDLRLFIAQRLPEYMIPSYFVKLVKFPLRGNGKIDIGALPKPDASCKGIEYQAPANEIEEHLARIWSKVLGVELIGSNDNFFDLGGHSISGTQLISRINSEFNLELKLGKLFSHPTIAELAKEIENAENALYSAISVQPVQEYYDVSHSQKRLWIIAEGEKNNVAYNNHTTYLLQGQLDLAAFQRAFQNVIDRHESLRTTFCKVNGVPKQRIKTETGYTLPLIDLRQEAQPIDKARELAEKDAITPFDLKIGPLIRSMLMQLADDTYVFANTMHHIVSDGWSMGILCNEVLELYNAFRHNQPSPLPVLKIQYKDYAIWQHELLNSPRMQEMKKFWLEKFSGQLPLLDLPTDYPRPEVLTHTGKAITLEIDTQIFTKLKALCAINDTTYFTAIFAGVYLVLYRYTGQTDMIIGTPIAGRNHRDLENLIGLFVNFLAIRLNLKLNQTGNKLIQNIRTELLSAFDHQEYPFDELILDLDVKIKRNQSPLFDVAIALQNTPLQENILDLFADLTIKPFYNEIRHTPLDLLFTFYEQGDSLILYLQYKSDLFAERTIDQMARDYIHLLASLVDNPESSIMELKLASEVSVQVAPVLEEIDDFDF